MSGYTPIRLLFTPFNNDFDRIANAIFKYLSENHELQPSFGTQIAKLIFDPKNGKLTETVEIDIEEKEIVDIVIKNKWVEVNRSLKIGRWFYDVSLFFFPKHIHEESVCLNIKFPSNVYESVYEFEPLEEGRFDEEAKKGILELCFGLANATNAMGFMLDYDHDELRVLEVEEILARLSDREYKGVRRDPGIITSIRNTLLSLKELKSVYFDEEGVYENTLGFVTLDFLLTDDDESDIFVSGN